MVLSLTVKFVETVPSVNSTLKLCVPKDRTKKPDLLFFKTEDYIYQVFILCPLNYGKMSFLR